MIAPTRLPRLNMLSASIATCMALAACGGASEQSVDDLKQTLGHPARALDTSPPTVTVTSQSAVDPSGAVKIAGQASDDRSLKQVTWVSNLGGSGAATLSKSSKSATWSATVDQLQVGDNQITFTAEDWAGNTSNVSITVTRVESTPATTDSNPPPVAPTTSSSADRLASAVLVSATRVPTEDWAAATSKYVSVPAWNSWVKSRMALVDTWRSKSRERADLVGGWMSDYIDPVTGIALTWTIDAPEPPDGVTDKEIRFKRAWVFYLRSYNVRMVSEAARIYRITGDTRYGEWAASQLDFYAANYQLWPLRTSNGKGRMYEHGLDEATSSFTLLDAARLLAGYAGTTRSGRWQTGLFMPMAVNLQTITSPLSNIGLWQSAAVTAIGMRIGDSSLIDWGLNSSVGVRATLAACITSDYLWKEGSFSYNAYVISALNSLFTASALEGQTTLVQSEKTSLVRLLLSPLDYRADDGTLPTPSDAAPIRAIDPNLHMQIYRVAPTYWGVQKASSYQSWDTLLDPPPAVPAEPTLAPPTTANFPGNRMAVLRNGNWQAFVHYGQVTVNHAQQEAPSYELFLGATPVSTDSGTVSYASPYHADYFSKAPANNMALVDGAGQASWAPGTVDLFDAANSRIAVTQSSYIPNTSVSRDLRTTAAGFSESTTLRTSDSLAHRLGVVFHTACTIRPLTGLVLADAASVRPPANASTAYWTGMTPYRASATWSVQLNCAGGTVLNYTVSGPDSQTVFIGQGPTTPLPATRAVLYYEATGQTAQFNAAISAN